MSFFARTDAQWNEVALSGPEIFLGSEDSMFSLKGRVSYDILMRSIPENGVPGNFSPVPGFRSPRRERTSATTS